MEGFDPETNSNLAVLVRSRIRLVGTDTAPVLVLGKGELGGAVLRSAQIDSGTEFAIPVAAPAAVVVDASDAEARTVAENAVVLEVPAEELRSEHRSRRLDRIPHLENRPAEGLLKAP